MNLYRICKTVHTPLRRELGWYMVGFETVMLIRAATPEDAIALAKRRDVLSPVVEPSKERLQ